MAGGLELHRLPIQLKSFCDCKTTSVHALQRYNTVWESKLLSSVIRPSR